MQHHRDLVRFGHFPNQRVGVGAVPHKNIIGRAALVYWPLQEDNNGLLPNVSAVFASVHQAGVTLTGQTPVLNVDGVLLLVIPCVFAVFPRRRSVRSVLVPNQETG